MNYTVHVTEFASRDLDDAFDYIDLILKNPAAADRLVDLFYEKASSLGTFPEKFPFVRDSFLAALEIRFLPVDHYMAFYKIDTASHTVSILRFLYGKSNWSATLKNDLLRS